MKLDSKTKLTGLFGYPVEHSLSPDMHNAAFDRLGLNYCYLAFSVHPDSLGRAVEGIRAMGFRGVNVTVPHKEKVLLMIDEIDPEAQFIGAVNTIVNTGGYLKGYNTDGRGFMRSLEENGIQIDKRTVFLMGAGGASRAVGYYLSQKASRLYIYDLDSDKAGRLSGDLQKLGKVSVSDNLEKAYTADILINATPLGLKPEDPLPFKTERLVPGQTVIDLIYKDTPVLKGAREKGCAAANGLGMLLWQGVLAFELWTGAAAPVTVMRDALLQGFAKK